MLCGTLMYTCKQSFTASEEYTNLSSCSIEMKLRCQAIFRNQQFGVLAGKAVNLRFRLSNSPPCWYPQPFWRLRLIRTNSNRAHEDTVEHVLIAPVIHTQAHLWSLGNFLGLTITLYIKPSSNPQSNSNACLTEYIFVQSNYLIFDLCFLFNLYAV